jgi:hypothetical protein
VRQETASADFDKSGYFFKKNRFLSKSGYGEEAPRYAMSTSPSRLIASSMGQAYRYRPSPYLWQCLVVCPCLVLAACSLALPRSLAHSRTHTHTRTHSELRGSVSWCREFARGELPPCMRQCAVDSLRETLETPAGEGHTHTHTRHIGHRLSVVSGLHSPPSRFMQRFISHRY